MDSLQLCGAKRLVVMSYFPTEPSSTVLRGTDTSHSVPHAEAGLADLVATPASEPQVPALEPDFSDILSLQLGPVVPDSTGAPTEWKAPFVDDLLPAPTAPCEPSEPMSDVLGLPLGPVGPVVAKDNRVKQKKWVSPFPADQKTPEQQPTKTERKPKRRAAYNRPIDILPFSTVAVRSLALSTPSGSPVTSRSASIGSCPDSATSPAQRSRLVWRRSSDVGKIASHADDMVEAQRTASAPGSGNDQSVKDRLMAEPAGPPRPKPPRKWGDYTPLSALDVIAPAVQAKSKQRTAAAHAQRRRNDPRSSPYVSMSTACVGLPGPHRRTAQRYLPPASQPVELRQGTSSTAATQRDGYTPMSALLLGQPSRKPRTASGTLPGTRPQTDSEQPSQARQTAAAAQ